LVQKGMTEAEAGFASEATTQADLAEVRLQFARYSAARDRALPVMAWPYMTPYMTTTR